MYFDIFLNICYLFHPGHLRDEVAQGPGVVGRERRGLALRPEDASDQHSRPDAPQQSHGVGDETQTGARTETEKKDRREDQKLGRHGFVEGGGHGIERSRGVFCE